ncbi:hypothetical protein T492DRAFT_1022775 [Pavlovales sp. CCMP2436]|nr:hypothetical protein T492DRAFT_1022775 [Pavlovales sp. CCMP2436]|mmetsp:Transcript_18266/g.45385  ORF Transcript_18266/g.45385 Transcript_18266/m.45385 type:complete len:301 (-) Transcript_18266:194-1096(-)
MANDASVHWIDGEELINGPANLNGEELIDGISYALYAHMVGSRAAPQGATMNHISAFDETDRRLTGDDYPKVSVHHLKDFIRKVYKAMTLEPEVLILAFVFVERYINAVGNVVRPTTVRPLILVAIGIACKTWYDEATFSSDLCDTVCGSRLNLQRLMRAEAIFVGAIRWHVVVSRKVFIKYYFALSELVHEVNRRTAPAPISRHLWVSAPHALESYAGEAPLSLGSSLPGKQLPDAIVATVRNRGFMLGRRVTVRPPFRRPQPPVVMSFRRPQTGESLLSGRSTARHDPADVTVSCLPP